jgi:hypothetical protein
VTICTPTLLEYPAVKRRRVQTSFDGGAITSDGGSLLLSQMDRRLGLTRAMARAVRDPRAPRRCKHTLRDLLRQRIYGLALGYEDQNDHNTLRTDPALQTAVGVEATLAGQSTISRWENRADRAAAWALHEVLVQQFIASFKTPPKELILDLDATDDRVHGRQEGRYFNAYYDDYIFLPLYVFCGDQLLAAYLRPADRGQAHHASAIMRLLITRLRAAFPKTLFIIRGDSGFMRPRLLHWCERNGVGYVLGMATNSRLRKLAEPFLEQARAQYEASGKKSRELALIEEYRAQSWPYERLIVVRAEAGERGGDARFVVTNIYDPARGLYEDLYCARGEMENRIKEQQLDLFADRTSCTAWWANQWRLLMSAAAYVLLERLRALALSETQLARATCGTIRLYLMKIGAVVIRNTRRVRLMLSSACPWQREFVMAARALGAG